MKATFSKKKIDVGFPLSGHFLCSRKLGLKKPASDRRQKIAILTQLKKRLPNLGLVDHDFQLDQTVEQTEIFHPTRPSDSCIRNVRKSRRILLYGYHTSTQQHDIRHNPTRQHRRRWLGRCHFCGCPARVSVTHPYLRPSAVRDSTRWPQRAVSMALSLPTAALAVALATQEIQRRDGLEGEMKDNAPRVKLTHCSRKTRGISMYAGLGAGAGS